ncbi:MAG: HAD family hydrolase [Dyella sp.]
MNLALFDFDGTLTTREMYADFMHAAVPPKRRLLGMLVLAPLVAGYKLGLVSGNVIRAAVVGVGLRGVSETHVRQIGHTFARETLPTVLRPEAMARLQWHREQGDHIVVVSGALDLYLSHWCQAHGLALICTQLQSRQGVLTGGFEGKQCVGEEKSRRVRQQYDLAHYPVVYAYGDTKEDLALLGLAHKRYYQWREVT